MVPEASGGGRVVGARAAGDASPSFADGRVALVVDNGTYAHIGRLPHPGNDAADVVTTLRRLSFER